MHLEKNTTYVRVGVTDIDGQLRGKLVSAEKMEKSFHQGLGFCDVIFGWDGDDKPYEESKKTGWHTGYPDALLTVDKKTHCRYPTDDTSDFYLGDFSNDSKMAGICPRSLLKNVISRYADVNISIKSGLEYEWYNFKREKEKYKALEAVSTGGFGYSLVKTGLASEFCETLWKGLAKLNVPLEGLHTETGDGIWEAAIAAGDALTAADRAIKFKHGVKVIAHEYSVLASFLAKWKSELPGNGGHLHLSLQDVSGEPLLCDPKNPGILSQAGQHFVAGILHSLPAMTLIYAPTINSYKRLVSGSWAANSVTWGYENRTTALRVIGAGENMRLEVRLPGADANPYLVMAAALAAGHWGMKEAVPLTLKPTVGNAYVQNDTVKLPSDLGAAIEMATASDLIENFFGKAFADHYIYTRRWEWQQFLKTITQWEIKRYLEW